VLERASVGEAITSLLANTDGTATMGMRGKKVFEEQAGATQRAVDAVVQLLSEGNA
jgi:hypothetical protein